MTFHLLDKIVPNDNFFRSNHNPGKEEQTEAPVNEKKTEKQLRKEAKKAEKARKKAEKARLKELKKQAKQGQTSTYEHEEGAINLSASAAGNAQIEVNSNANSQEPTHSAASLGSVFLIGGALILLATSAIFYGKRQEQSNQ